MKPVADEPRNANIVRQIDGRIAAARIGPRRTRSSCTNSVPRLPACIRRMRRRSWTSIADNWPGSSNWKACLPGTRDGRGLGGLQRQLHERQRPDKLGERVAVEELVAHDYDNAFPTLIRELLPIGNGIKGFVLAAIFGAVVSTLAAMLNSASTIATMDLYRKIHPNASQFTLVTVGRICVVLFVLIAMIIAPFLGHPRFGGIFNFIQEFQGFISSGNSGDLPVRFAGAPRSADGRSGRISAQSDSVRIAQVVRAPRFPSWIAWPSASSSSSVS